jgi:hypothetical protein
VHHPGPVDRVESLGQAGREREDRLRGQRIGLQQRRPGHVGGRQPRLRPVRVGVHHGGGEHPADVAHGRYLAREPHAELPLLRQLRLDDLDRDLPAAGGPGQVHLPHTAGPEPPDQPIRAH